MFYNLVLFFFNISIFLWFKAGIVEAIVGGRDSHTGQFKYQISLLADNAHVCGGAIIGEKHVLVAAHCVINKQERFKQLQFRVLAGIIDVLDEASIKINIKVKKIYVPTQFKINSPDPNDNLYQDTGDIAVLKLNNGFNLSSNNAVSALKLPNIPNRRNPNNYIQEEATIAGYGLRQIVNFDKQRLNDEQKKELYRQLCSKLTYANAIVISNDACKRMYPNPIYENHICAQTQQHDVQVPSGTCVGDSGSPLVYRQNTVVGVLSSGHPSCNEKSHATIYTRVSSFLLFISNAINDLTSPDIRVAEYQKQNALFGIFGGSEYLVEITN